MTAASRAHFSCRCAGGTAGRRAWRERFEIAFLSPPAGQIREIGSYPGRTCPNMSSRRSPSGATSSPPTRRNLTGAWTVAGVSIRYFSTTARSASGWSRRNPAALADVVALTSDDPVEDAIVALFNQGQLRGLPPFFLGDRMCLISRSAFERSRQRLSPGTGGPE